MRELSRAISKIDLPAIHVIDLLNDIPCLHILSDVINTVSGYVQKTYLGATPNNSASWNFLRYDCETELRSALTDQFSSLLGHLPWILLNEINQEHPGFPAEGYLRGWSE